MFIAALGLCLASLFPTPLRADVVISELFYNQPGQVEELEFVEIFNAGSEEIDLTGWTLSDGIEFAFRDGTRLPAGDRLVVVASLAEFLAAYPGVRTAGVYAGRLSNSGETIVLLDNGSLADSVSYDDDEDWPPEADGDGASLELVDPSVSRDVPGNWRPGTPPTPGAPNAAAGAPIEPHAYDVRLQPARLTSSDPLTVTARVFAREPVRGVRVRLEIDGVRTEHTMRDDGVAPDDAAADGRQTVTLGPFPDRTLAKLKVVLEDAAGTEREFPSGEDESDWYAAFVYDGGIATNAPIIWLFLSEEKLRILGNNAQIRSTGDARYSHFDDTFDGFLVLDGEVHRKVSVRHRGGFASRHAARLKYSWKFDFSTWDLYHGRSSLMVQGNMHWDDRWMRGDNGLQDKLCFMTFDRLGVSSPRTRFVRLMVNGEFFGYHVELEPISEEFLERNGYTGLGDLYKHGRSFQAHHFPLAASDYPDPRAYTKKSNDESDYSSIRTFCEELAAAASRGAASIESYLERVYDLDNYRRYLAGIILSTHWDSTNNNIQIYRNDLDGDRWVRFPWDMDITWGYSRRMPPPSQGHNLHPYDGSSSNPEPNEFGVSALRQAYLRVPRFREELNETLAEALVTTFTESEIHPVVDRILAEDGAESQADIDKWNALDTSWDWFPFLFHARYDKVYVSSRRKYLAEFLDREPLLSQPSVAPLPASPGDALTFVVNVLGNRYDGAHDLGPSNVDSVRLHLLVDGVASEHALSPVDARLDDFWRVTVPAIGRAARVHYRFAATDDGGREGFLPLEERDGYRYFTLDLETAAPQPDDVVINEVMYRARYYDVEFVELKNNLWRAVDVSGWRFESAANVDRPYVLPPGSLLPPRGYLALSRDTRAVFEYHNVVNIAATDLPFSLENDADTLALRDPGGVLIDWVLYEDDAPWPALPDGDGPSLELIDSRSVNEVATAWAASATQGTPGRPNSVSPVDVPPQPGETPARTRFHRGDADGDGELVLTDAVVVLGHLFLGNPPPSCRETADTNNDGALDLSDPVSLLNFLFLSGNAPGPPGPPAMGCGEDPDAPGSPGDLGCDDYPACDG